MNYLMPFKIPSVGFIALLNVISYANIFFCGWKMVRFVSQHATFNPQLKELNRQLTRNLILLASALNRKF
jgi:hypothetical protein